MGLPSITNVGGSLTSAAALTLLAWAVRFFRAAAQQRKQRQGVPEDNTSSLRLGKYFCSLTPAAVKLLVREHPCMCPSATKCHERTLSDMCIMAAQVETEPIPHVIVDIRRPDEITYNPLPEALKGGVSVPGNPMYCGHASIGETQADLVVAHLISSTFNP